MAPGLMAIPGGQQSICAGCEAYAAVRSPAAWEFPCQCLVRGSALARSTYGFLAFVYEFNLMGGVEGFRPFVLLGESEALTGFLQVVDQLMAADIQDLG